MLRYRADVRTLSFVSIYFGLVIFAWIAAPEHLALAIPLFVLICFFSFFGAAATHNTVHSPVFKSRAHNRVFQVVLTLTYGAPVSAFVPGHNLSHHKYVQGPRDVMRTTKTRHRWHLLNGLFFVLHVASAIMKGESRYFRAMRTRNPAWARQMAIEWIVLHGAYLALLLLDWKKALVYVLIPHKYAAWGIVTMNLLQHDGCDAESEYDHSRNFVGKLVNWFTFNNGFHTIHHLEPGLHWSLLPAAHAERVAPFIHPNLDQTSLLAYLWRTFFWPGKRVDYLGKPLVLAEAGEDQEWIPAAQETREDLGAIA